MADAETSIPYRKDPNFFLFDAMREGVEHPDRQPDEIFLTHGNAWTFENAFPEYRTLRRGTTVIDDFGEDRTEDAGGEFFPIFANKEEYARLKAGTDAN